MLFIDKSRIPADVAVELSRVKSAVRWECIDKADTVKIRSIFDQLDKSVIRSALVKEQKGLCAFCMRRIHESPSTSIEHLKPIANDGNAALDYRNMVACCDGGRSRS